MRSAASAAALACLLACVDLAHALSWPLCDQVGSTWVSAAPRLTGSFPYDSLLFFCTGNLNLEGSGVDSCINDGRDCSGQAAADAFCQYIGFDGAVEDQITIVPATEPVRAVTGEWCISPGVYSHAMATSAERLDTPLDAPAPAPAGTPPSPHCNRIDALTCYRERRTLSSALAALLARRNAPSPAPAPGADAAAAGPAEPIALASQEDDAGSSSAAAPAPSPAADAALPPRPSARASGAVRMEPSATAGRRLLAAAA